MKELGGEFLTNQEVLAELDKFEEALEGELTKARSEGRGKTFIERLEGRLEALKSARSRGEFFGEGQGVNEIPPSAISEVPGGTAPEAISRELATLRTIKGVRIGGRVLLVYGIYKSAERIAEAPPEARPRVATQEAGGWAVSIPAAWAGAKLGAIGGAALGIETGPGAVLTGAVGGIIGGGIGFFAGQAAVDWMWSKFE